MYSSLQNQLYNLTHFFFGFFVLFIFYPKLIFSEEGQSKLENLAANFIKMVFLVIIMGYLLVITALYEFIGISISLTLIFYIKNFIINKKFTLGEVITNISVYFYDFIDKRRSPVKDVLTYINKKKNNFKEFMSENLDSKAKNFNYLLLVIVIAYSAYLRFFDAITSPVPGMSDGNVTLAWMKYIARRELFYDGIYPQGFHITLATIQKFAYINPIYVLKYAGPFNEILIILGICFFLFMLTDRIGIGIIGASLYGILFHLLPIGWTRQAATNSQEFGFVFVLPTIYFAYKYIKTNEKNHLITTFSGISVLMLVHQVALSFAVIGILALSLAAIILKAKVNFKRVFFIGGLSFVAGIIGLLPIGYGIVMKIKFNEASKEYLLSSVTVDYPKLTSIDYIAIAAIVLMFLYFIIKIKNFSNNLFELFIFFFSVIAFLIYYAAGVLTKSSVVANRFSELWGLMIPVLISIGVYIFFKILVKNRIKSLFEITLTCAIITFTITTLKPQPIIPYKMEWDSRVEQYLKIDRMYRPTEWTIVSQEEGYAIVLGTGYHLIVKDFIESYDPSEEKLIDNNTKVVLVSPDIFIYYEKNIFKVTPEQDRSTYEIKKSEYERREQEKPAIQSWISAYEKNHNNLSKFYEDDNLIIYHIHQELTREELFNNIWEN